MAKKKRSKPGLHPHVEAELNELRRFRGSPDDYSRRLFAILHADSQGLRGGALRSVVALVAGGAAPDRSALPSEATRASGRLPTRAPSLEGATKEIADPGDGATGQFGTALDDEEEDGESPSAFPLASEDTRVATANLTATLDEAFFDGTTGAQPIVDSYEDFVAEQTGSRPAAPASLEALLEESTGAARAETEDDDVDLFEEQTGIPPAVGDDLLDEATQTRIAIPESEEDDEDPSTSALVLLPDASDDEDGRVTLVDDCLDESTNQ